MLCFIRFRSAWCWGNKWGNMPHGFQPIPADLDLAKPLETVPHVVHRDAGFGLISGLSV